MHFSALHYTSAIYIHIYVESNLFAVSWLYNFSERDAKELCKLKFPIGAKLAEYQLNIN